MALDVEALYRRYGDIVLGRCRTLLRDENDARETMQEIFLRLHRYKDRFRGDSSPSTYLFHITTTTCLNRLRTRRRHPEDPVEDFPTTASNDTLLDRLQMRQLVEKLLANADDTTRTCVVYHLADGMTYDEVGEIVGLSAAAVRKRIGNFRRSIEESPPPWLKEWQP